MNNHEIEAIELSGIKEKAVSQHLGKNGINGIGVGFKTTKGILTDILSVVFYVNDKQKHPKLPLPSMIEGYPVDVVEKTFSDFNIKKKKKKESDAYQVKGQKDKVNPIIGGLKIAVGSTLSSYSGTSAIIAKDSNGKEVILTNAHVVDNKVGTKIDQPDPVFFGSNVCAKVSASIEANHTHGVKPYYIDAAIATLDSSSRNFQIKTIYPNIQIISSKAPIVGSTVQKQGQITGLTSGTIKTVDLTYQTSSGVRYDNIIEITGSKFAASGDSGSAIFSKHTDGNNYIVGLFFAFNDSDYYACNITGIENAMQITF